MAASSASTLPKAGQNEIRYKRARQLLQRFGCSSISYMTLKAENELFLERKGEAYLAYRYRLGVAATVGDPIGSAEGIERCIHQFVIFCRQRGWTPVFFVVEKNLPIYAKLGLECTQVAEDAYLDLENLVFKGKHWQDVRTALNRAKREQLELHRLEPNSAAILKQIRQVSAEWQATKKLPEIDFLLGSVKMVCDPAVRTYYAQDSHGQVQGFVSWVPREGASGWALDLMRRRNKAMPGLMDFLIASSALQFKAEGYRSLGLGAVPLAPIQCKRALSTNEKMLDWLKPCLEGLYGFSSLYAFKQKFRPEWKPLYVFYPATSSYLRIGAALSLILCF
jgi:lysylphosphatidylglycerol synthetase-like protein (DUF2156 family)